MNFNLYYAAIRADDAFQRELERVYGAKACERRYQSARYSDVTLEAASDAKRAADDNWLTEMRRIPS
jgi:hypothetical protein